MTFFILFFMDEVEMLKARFPFHIIITVSTARIQHSALICTPEIVASKS